MWRAFTNAGQACAAVERVYVAEEVAGRFVELVVSKTGKLRQGVETSGPVDVGPS